MNTRMATLRNALLLFGVYFLAASALPRLMALIPVPASLVMVSILIELVVAHFVAYFAAGALLARVVESDSRLAWAIALGALQAVFIVYQFASPSRGVYPAMFKVVWPLVPIIAAGLGGLYGRSLARSRP